MQHVILFIRIFHMINIEQSKYLHCTIVYNIKYTLYSVQYTPYRHISFHFTPIPEAWAPEAPLPHSPSPQVPHSWGGYLIEQSPKYILLGKQYLRMMFTLLSILYHYVMIHGETE